VRGGARRGKEQSDGWSEATARSIMLTYLLLASLAPLPRFGYSFATPEAWDAHGHYRSLGYMRPLCIWGMVEGKGKKGGE